MSEKGKLARALFEQGYNCCQSVVGAFAAEMGMELEEAVRRGCVACYAAEGRYPPDLEYLKEHYGIQVDEGRYTVRYDAFAENLMPDITVLENTP